jgi:hypothetical protein
MGLEVGASAGAAERTAVAVIDVVTKVVVSAGAVTVDEAVTLVKDADEVTVAEGPMSNAYVACTELKDKSAESSFQPHLRLPLCC